MATMSASSSATAADRDVEAQKPQKISLLALVWDQVGLNDQMINHKYVGDGTEESPYVVDFLPEDPRNAMLFSKWFKWLITVLQAFATLAVAFSSSAYSGGIAEVMLDLGVSSEVAILGVSMFVVGFALGPLLWAPLSELYGRQFLFYMTYAFMTVFLAACAGAPNIEGLILLRFLAGAFGSSPLTNAGGVIADMFSASDRGIATSIFAMAPFLGPALGPIAGGFLGESAGWRWVEGMMAIFTGVILIISIFIYPETYAPRLLRRRAAALSKKTGKVYVSKLDAGKPRKSIATEFKIGLSRPWILLFKEPIVLLTSLYMAIVYGTLYLCFAAFPIVYQEGRGWSAGIGGLAFLGIAVGMTAAVVATMFDNKRYGRTAAKHGGMAPPEARLPPSLVGSILLPVGLFWFAWTNGPDIHWIVSIIGSAFFAAGIVLLFLSLFNYLIDSSSVLAANSVLRSLFGAIFPLFTTYMYEDLGIHWASSIPAFLALACVPCPFLFYKYGAIIRSRCKYSAEASAVLQKIRSAAQTAAQQQLEEQRQEEEAEPITSNEAMAMADEGEKARHSLDKNKTAHEPDMKKVRSDEKPTLT